MNDRRKSALAVIAQEDAEVEARLRAANVRIAEAEAELKARHDERAGIVSEAAAFGWSDRRIGAVLGLSKQRVAQIRRSAS